MRNKKEKIKLNINNNKPITKDLIYNSTLREIGKLCSQRSKGNGLAFEEPLSLYKDDIITIKSEHYCGCLYITIRGDDGIFIDSLSFKYFPNDNSIEIVYSIDNMEQVNVGNFKVYSLVKHFIRAINRRIHDKHFKFEYNYRNTSYRIISTNRLYMYSSYFLDRLHLMEKIEDLKLKIKDKEHSIKSYKRRIDFYNSHPYISCPIFESKEYYLKEIKKVKKSIEKLKNEISTEQDFLDKLQDNINKLKVNNYYANASESH